MSHKRGHYGAFKKKEEEKSKKKPTRADARNKFIAKQKEIKASQAEVNKLKTKTSRGMKPNDESRKAQDKHDKKYGLGKYKKPVTRNYGRNNKGGSKKSTDSNAPTKSDNKYENKVKPKNPKTNNKKTDNNKGSETVNKNKNNKALQNVTSSRVQNKSKSGEKRESLIDKIRKAGEASKAKREKEGYERKIKRTSSGMRYVYVKKKK